MGVRAVAGGACFVARAVAAGAAPAPQSQAAAAELTPINIVPPARTNIENSLNMIVLHRYGKRIEQPPGLLELVHSVNEFGSLARPPRGERETRGALSSTDCAPYIRTKRSFGHIVPKVNDAIA